MYKRTVRPLSLRFAFSRALTAAHQLVNVSNVEKFIANIFDQAAEHAVQLHEALGQRCPVFASLVPAFRDLLAKQIQQFGACLRSPGAEDSRLFVQMFDFIRLNYNLRLSDSFQLLFCLEDWVIALSHKQCEASLLPRIASLVQQAVRGILLSFADVLNERGLKALTTEEGKQHPEESSDAPGRSLLGNALAGRSLQTGEYARKSDKRSLFAAEFQQLKDAFHCKIANYRCLVAIQAPDGFGKTQLLKQFLAWIDKGYKKNTEKYTLPNVHFSRFKPIPGWTWLCFLRRIFAIPLGVPNVRERISQYVERLYQSCEESSVTIGGGELRNAIPELCDLCGEFTYSPSHGASSWRVGCFDALCKLIETLARLAQARTRAPLSLIFEDVNNADEVFWASLEAIMVRLPPNVALNVVITYNDQFTPKKSLRDRPFFSEVRLHAMLPGELNMSIDARLEPCGLQAESRQGLIDASKGSIVILENLLHRLISEGYVVKSPGGAWTEKQPLTPELLNDLMLFRSVRDHLSPKTKELLEIVSLMGELTGGGLLEQFAVQHAHKLLRPEVLTAATELDRVGLCSYVQNTNGLELSFGHNLLREAVYDSIEPEHKQSLHDELAALLESYRETSLASLWALHLSYGRTPEKAMKGWLLGIDRCIQLRELEGGRTLSDYAFELVQRCKSQAIPLAEQCRLALRRERLFWHLGLDRERREEVERLRELERSSDIDEILGPDEWGDLQLCLSRHCLMGGDRDNLSQALNYVQRQPHISAVKKGIAQIASSLCDWFDTQNSVSLIQLNKLVEQGELPPGSKARAMHAMALIELESKEFDAALHHAFEAWRYFRRSGAVISEAWLIRTIATLFWERGQLNEAEHLLRRALFVACSARNYAGLWLRVNFDLARLYTLFGDVDSAFRYYEEVENFSGVMVLDASTILGRSQDLMICLDMLAHHASLCIDQERFEEASDRLEKCLELIALYQQQQRENGVSPDRFDRAQAINRRCLIEEARRLCMQSNILVVQDGLKAIEELIDKLIPSDDLELRLVAYLAKVHALFKVKEACKVDASEIDVAWRDPDFLLDNCFYELDSLYAQAIKGDPSLECFGIEIHLGRCLWAMQGSDDSAARLAISKAWQMLMARMTALNASSRSYWFLMKPMSHRRIVSLARRYELPGIEKISALIKKS